MRGVRRVASRCPSTARRSGAGGWNGRDPRRRAARGDADGPLAGGARAHAALHRRPARGRRAAGRDRLGPRGRRRQRGSLRGAHPHRRAARRDGGRPLDALALAPCARLRALLGVDPGGRNARGVAGHPGRRRRRRGGAPAARSPAAGGARHGARRRWRSGLGAVVGARHRARARRRASLVRAGGEARRQGHARRSGRASPGGGRRQRDAGAARRCAASSWWCWAARRPRRWRPGAARTRPRSWRRWQRAGRSSRPTGRRARWPAPTSRPCSPGCRRACTGWTIPTHACPEDRPRSRTRAAREASRRPCSPRTRPPARRSASIAAGTPSSRTIRSRTPPPPGSSTTPPSGSTRTRATASSSSCTRAGDTRRGTRPPTS